VRGKETPEVPLTKPQFARQSSDGRFIKPVIRDEPKSAGNHR
jgi:hypothetical protein